jgi:hypothetical protein
MTIYDVYLHMAIYHGADLNFRKIDKDDMQLVTPAKNPNITQNVQKEGYRCMSHVWGNATRW